MPSAIGAQANLTGALTVFQGDLPYTPAVLADWSGVDPGLVRTALDRIAAALGPIARSPSPMLPSAIGEAVRDFDITDPRKLWVFLEDAGLIPPSSAADRPGRETPYGRVA